MASGSAVGRAVRWPAVARRTVPRGAGVAPEVAGFGPPDADDRGQAFPTADDAAPAGGGGEPSPIADEAPAGGGGEPVQVEGT